MYLWMAEFVAVPSGLKRNRTIAFDELARLFHYLGRTVGIIIADEVYPAAIYWFPWSRRASLRRSR
jgi:hypothetical protein